MTKEQGVFLANRNMAEYVFNGVKLSGCNITLVETQMILKGENVGHLSLRDIQRILNMRYAWNYMLATLENVFDLDYLREVNKYVFRDGHIQGGKLRVNKSKSISGASYIPKIPVKGEVVAEIERLVGLESVTERAIKLFLWMCKEQIFIDGNMRTGLVCANRMLISGGGGVLTIKGAYKKDYDYHFKQYCETGDLAIEQWLYDNCVIGFN